VSSPLPVTILTGFLGAGKTTLLNRILRGERNARIAVLVNDFGAVNIDAHLVDTVEGQAISLTNGCICCTMQGGLVQSMMRLLAREPRPDHVVVEASGIADPVGVVAAFRTPELREQTVLDGVVTVADAENFDSPRLDRQLLEDQVRAADLILLNKVDLVTPDALSRVRSEITASAPAARMLETVQADAPLDIVLGIGGTAGDLRAGAALPNRFETWTYHTHAPLAYRRVKQVLATLPPAIFRAKGILHLADAPALEFVAQVVGSRVALDVRGRRVGDPETVLVFIGERDCLDRATLHAALDGCVTGAVPLLPALRRSRGATAEAGIG